MSAEAVAAVGRRRRFSEQFKRGVVQETLARGASVAAIALRHRVNANQVFNWRRKYLRESAVTPARAVKMLPVTIEAATHAVMPASTQLLGRKSSPRSLARGSIDIEYAQATIRVRGRVDAEALRVVLDVLLRR